MPGPLRARLRPLRGAARQVPGRAPPHPRHEQGGAAARFPHDRRLRRGARTHRRVASRLPRRLDRGRGLAPRRRCFAPPDERRCSWPRLRPRLALFVAASGSGIAAPAQDGEWSAPIAWPIVAVHMSLEPTGEVFSLDGFDNAVNSERMWNPDDGHVPRRSLRPQPLLLRPRATPRWPDPDRRRSHQRLRRSQRHNALQRHDEHVLPGRRHGRIPLVPHRRRSCPDGRVFVLSGDRITQDRPGQLPPFSDASVNSLPEVYDPKTNTWTSLPSGQLTSPLYPYPVRALRRPHPRCRPRSDDTRPRHRGRGHGRPWRRARSTGTALSCTARTRS